VLKVVQAVTGAIFVLFVLSHMIGNLKVYAGRESFNKYPLWLKDVGSPVFPSETFLWIMRVVLAVAIVAHILTGITLWVRARRAKGAFARKPTITQHGVSGRSMIYTGVILGCYVVFHLLDLTIGRSAAATSDFVDGSAYDNLVHSFSRPAVGVFYIVVMALLFFHLMHGMWSITNDLGGSSKRVRSVLAFMANLVASLVVLGNLSIPIAVLAGWVTL